MATLHANTGQQAEKLVGLLFDVVFFKVARGSGGFKSAVQRPLKRSAQ